MGEASPEDGAVSGGDPLEPNPLSPQEEGEWGSVLSALSRGSLAGRRLLWFLRGEFRRGRAAGIAPDSETSTNRHPRRPRKRPDAQNAGSRFYPRTWSVNRVGRAW